MYDSRLLVLCCCIASAALLYPSLFSKSVKYAKADPWALETVASTYQSYHSLAQKDLNKMRQSYNKLDAQSKRLGKGIGYPDKLDRLAAAEEANAKIARGIADLAIQRYNLSTVQTGTVFRVREAMQHFVRDWSEEGAEERKKMFTPILEQLGGGRSVLVPGAGLGRLAWEISQLGA